MYKDYLKSKIEERKVELAIPSDFFISTVVKADKKREGYRFNWDNTNVSDLMHQCPKFYTLILEQPEENRDFKFVNSSDRILWALGRAAETHVRAQYAAAKNYQGIFGVWHHPNNETVESKTGLLEQSDLLSFGGEPLYKEYRVTNSQYELTGSPDFLPEIPMQIPGTKENYLMVYEFKSIKGKATDTAKEKGFDDLEEAKPDHCYQPSLYARLAQQDSLLAGKVYPWKVGVVYVRKEYMFEREDIIPYKEFHVDTQDSVISSHVDGLLEVASAIKHYRKTRIHPDAHKLCQSVYSKHAKKCPLANKCFSQELKTQQAELVAFSELVTSIKDTKVGSTERQDRKEKVYQWLESKGIPNQQHRGFVERFL